MTESLVEAAAAQPHFVGSRCSFCHHLAFPPRRRCSNCGRTRLGRTPIAPVGTVYSFTVVHLAQSGVAVPYALAIADFPGNVRVFGRVVDWHGRLEIGAQVTAAEAPAEELTGVPAADYRLRLVEGERR